MPRSASVRRSGQARTRRSSGSGGGFIGALLRNVLGPLGLVLLGIGLVLVVGWYVTSDHFKEALSRSAEKGDSTLIADSKEPVQQPPDQPAAPQQPAPQQPAPQTPAPTDEAGIRAARQQINRAGSAEAMKLVVYYVDGLSDGTTLQPVEMAVPVDRGRIRVTVENILNAPTELKLHSQFPAGTVLRSVNLQDGVAVVDLSPEAGNVRGSAASTALQYVLVYSLTEIQGVNAVLLRLDGHPAQLDQIVWDKPVTRDQLKQQNLYEIAPLISYQGL